MFITEYIVEAWLLCCSKQNRKEALPLVQKKDQHYSDQSSDDRKYIGVNKPAVCKEKDNSDTIFEQSVV
ncbi:hypothetical protein I4U23_020109 [Adineta vaga]|nr:hypothetical protein I4U23_020109 [Adineta vaga]